MITPVILPFFIMGISYVFPSASYATEDLNQTGLEKGGVFKAFPSYNQNVKHEFSNKISIKPLLKQIDQMNAPDFPWGKACTEDCPAVSPENEQVLIHQCAVDICGPPHQNPKFIFDNTHFDEDIDPHIAMQFDQYIAPIAKSAIDSYHDYYKYKLNQLRDIKSNLLSNTEHPLWDHIADGILQGKTFIEEEQKIQAMNAYHKKRQSIREEMANTIKEKTTEQGRQFLKPQIQSFLSNYENNQSRFSTINQSAIEYLSDRLKHLDNMGKTSIEVVAGDFSVLSARMTKPLCMDESCKRMVMQEINKIEDNINTRKQDDINYCKSTFIEQSHKIKQAQTFKKHLPQYRDAIIKTGFANYSTESRQQFENFTNNSLSINIPNTDTVQHFEDHIKDKIVNISDYTKQSERKSLRNLLALSQQESGVCPRLSANDFNGFAYDLGVYLSVFSCNFHDHGKKSLAHEIGHAVSHVFSPIITHPIDQDIKMSELSYEKYKKLRQCGTQRYKNGDLTQSKSHYKLHENDKIKTEEDTADLFSYMVFQDDPTHYQCALLTTSKDGGQYEDLQVLYDNKHPMKDRYSTFFLRVLMEAIHKRTQLSPACQQVIDKYKDRINFKPCF